MSFGNFGSKPMKTPKAPKAPGKKPFSSRTVIGVVCIVLALLITFGVAPLVNRFTDQKVDIVRLKADVPRGQIITADHLEVVNVGSYNLPNNVIKDGKAVVGKYAATDLYAGDYLFDSKLTLDNKSADDVLLGLDGKKVAISVNISDFAAGLSDKLENGDIVSVIIYDKENNISYTRTDGSLVGSPISMRTYRISKLPTASKKRSSSNKRSQRDGIAHAPTSSSSSATIWTKPLRFRPSDVSAVCPKRSTTKTTFSIAAISTHSTKSSPQA